MLNPPEPMVGDVGRRLETTAQHRPHTGSSITRRSKIETTAPLCHTCQPPMEEQFRDLSCAPALCTVHLSTLGNTDENLKRMQGTRESPKISVIEIPSNTNLATASL